MQNNKQPRPVAEQVSDFEKKNPQIAGALHLFDITMTEYLGAINAMSGPRIYHTSRTAQGKHDLHDHTR